MRDEVRARRREGGGASSVQGRTRLHNCGGSMGGVHVEHPAHVCDAGSVESQWLVERPRALPRFERRAYDSGRYAGRGVVGGGRRRRKLWVKGRARLQTGDRARAKCTKNMTRMFVTREVSKLSGWLNADADCRAERMAYNAMRGAGRQTGGRQATAAQAACKGGLNCILEGKARRRAHREHVAHVCDARSVKIQRLVERSCVLPSRKEGIRCVARCGLGAGWCAGRGLSARRACSSCL